MRTLILDDEEPVVKLLTRFCAANQHDVTPFTSSEHALVYLASEPIDLLITDIHMPSPDGIAVIKQAQQLQPHIFTLIITGYAGQYPLEELLASGMTDVMFKPFHMNELRARLTLAEGRRTLIDVLHRERQELQMTSNEMIEGLQNEVEEARKAAAAQTLLK